MACPGSSSTLSSRSRHPDRALQPAAMASRRRPRLGRTWGERSPVGARLGRIDRHELVVLHRLTTMSARTASAAAGRRAPRSGPRALRGGLRLRRRADGGGLRQRLLHPHAPQRRPQPRHDAPLRRHNRLYRTRDPPPSTCPAPTKPVALPVRYGGPAPLAPGRCTSRRDQAGHALLTGTSSFKGCRQMEPPRRARLMRPPGTAVMEAVSATEVGGPVTSTAPRSPTESS